MSFLDYIPGIGIPGVGNITDIPGVQNWLVGGDATKDINPKLNHGDYMGGYLQNALGGLGGQRLNFGAADQSRGQMGQLASQLQGVASGTQKGAGEMAVDRQMGQATAAQQALANMARGSNTALAMRNAGRNQADLGVAGAGQAQQAALNDQTNARGQLAGLLSQMRSGDFTQQGLQQQNYNGQNSAAQGYLGQLLGLDQAQLQALLQKNQLGMQDQGHLAALLQAAGSAAIKGGV